MKRLGGLKTEGPLEAMSAQPLGQARQTPLRFPEKHLAVEADDLVNVGVLAQKRCGTFGRQKADVRRGEEFAKPMNGRRRHQHVAQGMGLYDKYARIATLRNP
jgi:hypothetical protein